MRSFIVAIVCSAAIGFGASYLLHMQQETVDVAFSSSGTRVGDPGHNLVRINWKWDPSMVGEETPVCCVS